MTVTVYSKPQCMACTATYQSLDIFKIEYETVDITQSDEAFDFVKKLGYNSLPVVYIDDNNHWAGFNPSKIQEITKADCACSL